MSWLCEVMASVRNPYRRCYASNDNGHGREMVGYGHVTTLYVEYDSNEKAWY